MTVEPLTVSMTPVEWKALVSAADCGLIDLDREYFAAACSALSEIEDALDKASA